MVAGYPALVSPRWTGVVSLAPVHYADNANCASRLDRGTESEILMNLISPNITLILPFGQLAGLIGLCWLAMVGYRMCEGMIAAIVLDRVKGMDNARRVRVGVPAGRNRNRGSSDNRMEPAPFSTFSDDEEGT